MRASERKLGTVQECVARRAAEGPDDLRSLSQLRSTRLQLQGELQKDAVSQAKLELRCDDVGGVEWCFTLVVLCFVLF
jgi:hypothetical protein